MSRSRLVLIAVASIGFTGAATPMRVPVVGSGAGELTSSGSVANALAPRRFAPRKDDREFARRAIRIGEQGTYISEILRARDSVLARWPDRRGKPLRAWIQMAPPVFEWHGGFVEQVRAAFESWDELRLPVRFEIVTDSIKADVHVTWIDRFKEPISGRTRWTRNAGYWITDASIILAVHHRSGEILEDDAMHAMALHEIGHLLGLDHTSDPSNVMAPKVRVRSLSDADRATARLLYSLPAGQYSSR